MRCMGCALSIHQKECRKILGCVLSTRKYGNYKLLKIATAVFEILSLVLLRLRLACDRENP
jgi:hypothetical protein